MPRYDDRDWGSEDRPWSARHPLASRLLTGGAIAGGSVLLARIMGPQLLRGAEGMVRRELSSAIGPGRRPGHLYSAFRSLGILERLPGVAWDAAGRATPMASEYEQLSGWYRAHVGYDGHLGRLHHDAIRAHGVRYLAGHLTGAGAPATDELLQRLNPAHLRALRELVSHTGGRGESRLVGDWWHDAKWQPLRELHAATGRHPASFATDIRQLVGEWHNERDRAHLIMLFNGQARGFDPWFQYAATRIQNHRSMLGRVFGMQEAAADPQTFSRLVEHERQQLESQLAHGRGGRVGPEWMSVPGVNPDALDHGPAAMRGARIDPHIYDLGRRGLVDTRVSSAVMHGLWNEVKSGFQLPLIPYAKAFHPLQGGLLGSVGRHALNTGSFQIGQLHPTIAGGRGALINPMVFAGDTLGSVLPAYDAAGRLSGMSFSEMPGTYARVAAGSRMAGLVAEITGLRQGAASRAASLPGPLGRMARWLDLGADGQPTALTTQLSRIRKFADPLYPGNLARRIWNDPVDQFEADAVAKKRALQAAFLKVSGLDDQTSPIFRALHGLTGQLIDGGGLAEVHQLQTVHNVLSQTMRRDTRSERMGFFLSQRFDEIRESRRLDQFRKTVAEEVVLRRLFPRAEAQQQDVLEFLGRGTIRGHGAQADTLLTAFMEATPSNRDARAWMTGTLLGAVDDANAPALLAVLRDAQGGQLVRGQLEGHVYRRAFPALSAWLPEQESPFAGTPFIAIRKGPALAPSREIVRGEDGTPARLSTADAVTDMLANWNEHLHQLWRDRRAPGRITTATVGQSSPYAKGMQVNAQLAQLGLGLSPASTGSALQLWGNLALKRALPIAAAAFYGGYASWEVRRALYGGQADDRGNAPGPLANLQANLGVGWTALKQVTGITALQRGLVEYLPGADNYFTPRTVKEYKQYLTSGYDPVRQGAVGLAGLSRLNFFNDTPIYGGKIMYWQPSWYARAAADGDYSKTGMTRDEFYKYAWLPTPRHPFAPLNRLLNPYVWEETHADDRPYPVSGALFAGSNRYLGPIGYLARPFETLGNAVLGPVLKPTRIIDRVYDDLADAQERMAARASGQGYAGAPSYLHRILGMAATAGSGTRTAAQRYIGGMFGGGVGSYGLVGAASGCGSGGGGSAGGFGLEDAHRDDVPQGGLLRLTPLGKKTLYQTTTPALYDRMAALNRRIHGKDAIERLGTMEAYRRPRERDWYGPADVEPGPSIGEQAAEVATSLGYLSGMTSAVNRLARTLTGGGLLRGDVHDDGDPVARLAAADQGYGGSAARGVENVNPLRNRMPGWLPGPEGYVNFLEGDPYTKVRGGETRLPGYGYEKLHRVKVMETRASSLGKSTDDIMAGMLHLESPMSRYAEEAADAGTRIHRQIQRRWMNSGVAESVETELYDKKTGISGHLDAILRLPEGRTVVDIKTVNDRRYRQSLRGAFDEHLQQVNWYMHETGIGRGAIMYLNRDNPEQTHVEYFGYSAQRYNAVMRKVAEARTRLNQMLDQGAIQRGDLYDPLTRFKILADVAPFSEQTKQYAHRLSEKLEPDTPEWRQFQEAKARLQQQKQSYHLYPYRFGRANEVREHDVTVDRIIDPNTFTTKEDPEHPIRLAGIRVAQAMIGRETVGKGAGARLDAMAREAKRQFLGNDGEAPRRMLDKLLYVLDPARDRRQARAKDRALGELAGGPFVKLGKVLAAGLRDPGKRPLEYDEALGRLGLKPGARVHLLSDLGYKADSLKTERSIAYIRGHNINRELLDRGWAREQRDRYSPVQTHLYYSPAQRMLGRLGEAIAHADTPFNDKFLRARSPLEEYERGQLYGKSGGSWRHPIRDRVVPSLRRIWHQHPLAAAATGALAAGAFWQTPGARYETNLLAGQFGILNDKVRLAVMGAGALVGYAGSVATHVRHVAGDPWIPDARRREWALQEYFDTLDYVKSRRLSRKYSDLAWKKEGVDVPELLRELRMRAVGNKRDKQAIEIEKSRLVRQGGSRTDDRIRDLNAALRRIGESETLQGLPPLAARAVAYEHAAEKTLYGLPPWATVGDRLQAIPRAHRQIISEAMEHGSSAEKRRLVRELPAAEARIIGRQLDPEFTPEARENLVQYFQQHFLPRDSWAGWDEDQSLQPAMAKEIQRLGMDPQDAGPLYHTQYRTGLRHPLAVGPFDRGNHGSTHDVRSALYDMLGDHVDGLDIQVTRRRGHGSSTAAIDLQHDRDDDYTTYLNRNKYAL